MVEVVGIRFKTAGKIYYFSPKGIEFSKGDYAVVETVRGTEIGEVMLTNRQVSEENIVSPLKPVLRKATDEDVKKIAEIIRTTKQLPDTELLNNYINDFIAFFQKISYNR